MRIRYNREPMVGETREVSGFLWWPRTINRERRWLEFAVRIQIFCLVLDRARGMPITYYDWRDMAWIDEAGHAKK